ncbi:MAG TPA: hypothetical protein VGC60_10465, partial [Pyrinomonadaceae bacterium]
TACCLYSGDQILDYSGHLLNLASRLNDLARPSGIVIDGNYLSSVIPETQRGVFKSQQVYLRGIAEDHPVEVFFLDKFVRISDVALSPIADESWNTVVKTFTKGELLKMQSFWRQDLSNPAKSKEKIKVTITRPRRDTKKFVIIHDFKDFSYSEEGSTPVIRLNVDKLRALVDMDNLARNGKVSIKFEYVPKTLPRTATA